MWGKGFALLFAVMVGVMAAFGQSAPATPNPRDTLVYKDGDRVQGTLVENAGTIVFKSDRFGELRVPSADAVVIKAEKPAPPEGRTVRVEAQGIHPPVASANAAAPAAPAKPEDKPETPAERAEAERISIWERFSPAVLTARVRNYFGPWHGRLAFSTEVVSDSADRNNLALEGQLQRKWERNELQLNGRYDYAKTNNVPTTDMIKGSGLWRHEFTKKQFALYRPTAEWNRAARRSGVRNEYVLLQQELGVGFIPLSTPGRKLRAGVSYNLFDVWNSAPVADHSSRAVMSTFEEAEFTLPWRMTLAQRGVWYPVRNDRDGWENRVELNKKLTETLSTSLRHEIRRDNPDGSAQDYTRLKLLFGLDF